MKKKVFAWLFILLAVVFTLPGANALAAPDITVSVSTGFDGKSKLGKGAPVLLTIENNGSPFSGDLVIDMDDSYNMGAGRAIPLDIESGETKTVSFTIARADNGHGFSSNLKRIFLYEGGWKKGEEISHRGAQQLNTSSYPDDSAFLLLFTNNADRLAALKDSNISSSKNTQIINASKLHQSNLPDEAFGWESIDFIIIDEYPIADLPTVKQDAIVGWVRSGGVLVIGGSNNIKGEMGNFSDYLPLDLKGQTVTNPSILNEWTKTEGFELPIPSYEAELRKGATSLIDEDGNTLAAYQSVGDGLIYQTAFSIGDDPIAKMEGMPALWEGILNAGGLSFHSTINPHNSPLENLSNGVGNANELFPSFKVSTPLLFGVIILYIIVIIPVLYFVLKRKDKREYTWVLIPIIALITSLAIFGYGAKDRIGRTQIQHTAIVNVEPDGGMTGYFAESILSNKSGSYTFTTPIGTKLSASLKQDLFGANMNAMHKGAMVEKDVASNTINLRKVGFWNVASVYGETRIESIGQLAINLSVTNKTLAGTVTNDYPFALTDVAIWSGTDLLPIGDLGPGESVQINEVLKTPILLSRAAMNNYSMNPQQAISDDLTKMRKDTVLSFSSENMNKIRKPAIIGYTDTQIIPITLENTKSSLSALTLIVQPIEVESSFDGVITVDPEMMEMSVVSENREIPAESHGYPNRNEYYFDQAVYFQSWKIPIKVLKSNLHWTSFELTKVRKELYTISLLNLLTDEFELLDTGDYKITENIDTYLSPEGEIVFRIDLHDTKNGNYTTVPDLKVTGEVAP